MNNYIKKHGRMLEHYLMEETNAYKLYDELLKYQNEDGGFGHGLELDIQAPISNIPSTDVAISYLSKLDPSPKKNAMIERIIQYYESTFDHEHHRWFMVEIEVDNYPRAIWWNYDARESFGLLNPTPEILGFLYRHQDKVTKINLEQEIMNMVNKINLDLPKSTGFHDVLSILRMYRDIPKIRTEIFDVLFDKTREFLTDNKSDYHLRAHQVAMISMDFVTNAQLRDDIDLLKDEIANKGYIECQWSWFQYNDEFAKIKPYWNAFLTREAIEAIDKFDKKIL